MELKEQKEYHVNGQLKYHCFILNDKCNGETKYYYENGQLETRCFYLNGKLHGEYKPYYQNGQLMYHYFYLNGKQIDAPLLPKKPSRLPFKSNTTRFQTLEI